MDDEKIDPVVATARKYGGYVQIYARKKRGVSYVYFYYQDGTQRRRYFPAGLRIEEVQAEIIRIQEDLLYQKRHVE
jgi:hypothetical protein